MEPAVARAAAARRLTTSSVAIPRRAAVPMGVSGPEERDARVSPPPDGDPAAQGEGAGRFLRGPGVAVASKCCPGDSGAGGGGGSSYAPSGSTSVGVQSGNGVVIIVTS